MKLKLPLLAVVFLFIFSQLHAQIRYVEVNIEQPGIEDCMTSIQEKNDNLPVINVYPNPGNGLFSIEINGFELNKPVKITVYSIASVEVYKINKKQLLPNHLIDIDLTQLNKGVYILKVSNQDKFGLTRIVIL